MKPIFSIVVDPITTEYVVLGGDVERVPSPVPRRLIWKTSPASTPIVMDLAVDELIIVGGKPVVVAPPDPDSIGIGILNFTVLKADVMGALVNGNSVTHRCIDGVDDQAVDDDVGAWFSTDIDLAFQRYRLPRIGGESHGGGPRGTAWEIEGPGYALGIGSRSN